MAEPSALARSRLKIHLLLRRTDDKILLRSRGEEAPAWKHFRYRAYNFHRYTVELPFLPYDSIFVILHL